MPRQIAYKRRSYDIVDFSLLKSVHSPTDNRIVNSNLNIFLDIMGLLEFSLCLLFLILGVCSIKATPVNDLSKGLTEFSTEFYLVNI